MSINTAENTGFRVVALAGHTYTGKTLLANLVKYKAEEDYGIKGIKVLSFAEPLKKMYAQVMGIPLEHLYLKGLKDQHRQGLEEYSNTCKAHDKLIFTNRLLGEIGPEDKVLIDDLRLFDIELLPLLEVGASCYRLIADEAVRKKRGANPSLTDKSFLEQELNLSQETWISLTGNPFIFNNKDSSEDLEEHANRIIRRHFCPKVLQ